MKTRKWNILGSDGKFNAARALAPTRWRSDASIYLEVDIFRLRWAEIDFLFAVIASCNKFKFNLRTTNPKRGKLYMERIKGPRADRSMLFYRRHLSNLFDRNKKNHTAGFHPVELPTPALRAIYDGARMLENGSNLPVNHRLPEFSGGEFHWRDWPLENVVIEGMNPVTKKKVTKKKK